MSWLVDLLGHEPDEKFKQRFWSKVDVKGPNDCWEWQLSRNSKGYGLRSIYDKHRLKNKSRLVMVHRVAYTLQYGDIPKGKIVCHTCDNPPCCNPHHLFVGTNALNQLDCRIKGRKYSKLSEKDVSFIRSQYERNHTRQLARQLANIFGVHVSLIRLVARRKSWKHIA